MGLNLSWHTSIHDGNFNNKNMSLDPRFLILLPSEIGDTGEFAYDFQRAIKSGPWGLGTSFIVNRISNLCHMVSYQFYLKLN